MTVGLCAALLGGSAALAHPHVWIDAKYRVVMTSDAKVEAIEVEWTFDDVYSAFQMEDLDGDGDGLPDADRMNALAKHNIESLAAYDWFVVARSGENIVDAAPPTIYGYGYADKRLTLRFTLPLAQPVDPRAGGFRFSGFDPMFYIDIRVLSQGDVVVVGDGSCGAFVIEPEQTESTLGGGTWQKGIADDAYMGFGDSFAQRIDVRC